LLPVSLPRRASASQPEPADELARLADAAGGQMTAENFPVALRVLPARARRDLARIYTFARFVDDIGDEAHGDPAARLGLLDAVDRDVRALADPAAAAPLLPPVAGLAELVAAGRIPIHPLLDLVEANRIDQQTSGYETFEDLLGYCLLSAAPVGRLVLHLAGAASPVNLADSDAVCNALQVLEHCQDVAEDHRLGRCYLPERELRAAGVDPADLGHGTTSLPVRRVVAQQVSRSRDLLAHGAPLVGRLSGWARLAVAGFVAGGLATADALDAAQCDVLARDIKPSKRRTLRHMVRLLRERP
jgi:squalene synthase HpnC